MADVTVGGSGVWDVGTVGYQLLKLMVGRKEDLGPGRGNRAPLLGLGEFPSGSRIKKAP